MCAKYTIILSLLALCDLTKFANSGYGPNFITVDKGLNKDFTPDIAIDNFEIELAETRNKNNINIKNDNTSYNFNELIDQMPKNGELHIHTIIKYDKNMKVKTENHYYICQEPGLSDTFNRLCTTTNTLIEHIKFRSSDIPNLPKVALDSKDLLEQEYQLMVGSNVSLNAKEQDVNRLIMRLKSKILDYNYKGSGLFFSKHFFDFKDTVKATQLYKIIKNMPKGAALHTLDVGLLGPAYLLEVTYHPNLFVCFQNNEPTFIFSKSIPVVPCKTLWLSMEEARSASKNSKKFDEQLRKHLTLVIDNPKEESNYVNFMWKKYQKYILTVYQLLSYQPVWEKYFYDALKAFREDKVMYIEINSVLPRLYDLDGKPKDSIHTAIIYKKIVDEFVLDYPDFHGAKLIYNAGVLTSKESLKQTLRIARKLKRNLPNFFIGVNLIGQQEDKGRPLKYFKKDLMKAKSEFDIYFHVGKSNWYEWLENDIFDAVALNAKRIGHSYALVKHPMIINEIKKKDICLEINIVSNMVLKAFDDIRNHPLAQLLAYSLPIVLTSESPGIWEADKLSHDFFVAFVGIAGKQADLKILKQLAMNSIIYSSGNDGNIMMERFLKQWDEFIRKTVPFN